MKKHKTIWLNTLPVVIENIKKTSFGQPKSWYEFQAKRIIESHIDSTYNNYKDAVKSGERTKEEVIEIIKSADLPLPNYLTT